MYLTDLLIPCCRLLAGQRGATFTGGAVTPPRSAPPHDGRGGRHGAYAGGWGRPPRDGVPLTVPVDRRELVPAKRTPDETNEKQTMIPSGIRLFVVWRSSDTRAPDASQTKASFVSSVTRRSRHVRGPNLERAGHAFVSGLACAARRHTESLQEPASGQGLAADSKEITLIPTAHLLADFTS